MIIKVLIADLRSTMGIRGVAPTDNARIRNIRGEEITEPVDVVHRPSLLTVSIESVDGHNATIPS